MGNSEWFMLGAVTLGVIITLSWNLSDDREFLVKYKALVAECEKNLPRNVTCELMAKPKEVEE